MERIFIKSGLSHFKIITCVVYIISNQESGINGKIKKKAAKKKVNIAILGFHVQTSY